MAQKKANSEELALVLEQYIKRWLRWCTGKLPLSLSISFNPRAHAGRDVYIQQDESDHHLYLIA
jgi:hypothetical protein